MKAIRARIFDCVYLIDVYNSGSKQEIAHKNEIKHNKSIEWRKKRQDWIWICVDFPYENLNTFSVLQNGDNLIWFKSRLRKHFNNFQPFNVIKLPRVFLVKVFLTFLHIALPKHNYKRYGLEKMKLWEQMLLCETLWILENLEIV